MTNEEARELIINGIMRNACIPKEKDWWNGALLKAIEALEKQIPKKPKIINKHETYCPKCWDNKRYFPVDNKHFSVNLNPEHEKEIRRITYCKHCGQAIDWSE